MCCSSYMHSVIHNGRVHPYAYNSMSHSLHWEANSSWACQEIPRILRNPVVHCCMHNSPPLVPILSLINSVHSVQSHFFKMSFSITLSSSFRSSHLPPSFRSLLMRATFPSSLTLLSQIWRKLYKGTAQLNSYRTIRIWKVLSRGTSTLCFLPATFDTV